MDPQNPDENLVPFGPKPDPFAGYYPKDMPRNDNKPRAELFFKRSRNVSWMKLRMVSDTVAYVEVDGMVLRCVEQMRDGVFWKTGIEWLFSQNIHDQPIYPGVNKVDGRLKAALMHSLHQLFEAKQNLDPFSGNQFEIDRLDIDKDFPTDILSLFAQKLKVESIVFNGVPSNNSFLDHIEGVMHVRVITQSAEFPTDLLHHPTVRKAQICHVGQYSEEQFAMDLIANHNHGVLPIFQPELVRNFIQTWITEDRGVNSYMMAKFKCPSAVEQFNKVTKSMPGSRRVVNHNDPIARKGDTLTFVPFGWNSTQWLKVVTHEGGVFLAVVDGKDVRLKTLAHRVVQSAQRAVSMIDPIQIGHNVVRLLHTIGHFLRRAVRSRLPDMTKKN